MGDNEIAGHALSWLTMVAMMFVQVGAWLAGASGDAALCLALATVVVLVYLRVLAYDSQKRGGRDA